MTHPFRLPALAALLLVLGAIAGCSVRFISAYDSVLDQDVTTLQTSTETYLNQLGNEYGTDAATYHANADFYARTGAALATMETRAASQPNGKVVTGQVQAVQATFADLEKLHKLEDSRSQEGLTPVEIKDIRGALESEFQSILTLQLALKHSATVPSSAMAPSRTPAN